MDNSPTHCTEAERQLEIRKGVEAAWRGIKEDDKKASIAFYMNYAYTHKTFSGGDVLAAWRETDDPRAHQDWRNKWGALSTKMKKHGVIERISYIKPKNRQSHGSGENLWQSMVYRNE
jgi:hypothetical protein